MNALWSVLIILSPFAVLWAMIAMGERLPRRRCAACEDGTVLFVQDSEAGKELCHRHWRRWDRIRALERDMDSWGSLSLHERQDALDLLLRRLDEPREYQTTMRIAGDWLQIGRLPPVPTEPGAVSPKSDGSR